MTNDKKRFDSGDDIRAILHHSGVASTRLERFEKVSSQMWNLEWKMLKRAADNRVRCRSTAAALAAD